MMVNADNLNSPVRDADREFFERELASFVPDRIFDAHCHLLPPEGAAGARLPAGIPTAVGLAEYRALIDCLHPGRPVSGLFIPFPADRTLRAAGNGWIARNVAQDPSARGLFLVCPEDDPEWVRDQVRAHGLHGLKCYHTLARMETPTWEAEIPAYLPEPLVRVAHEEGWVITLHMVRSRAVADAGNRYWIRRYCERYPGMKLILAHSARGFQPAHNLEGLPDLAGLDNLYFDTSANCEPLAHETILRFIGHDRLMYGSDFWVSHFRGRSLGAADSFLWLYEDTPVWGEKHLRVEPALVGMEHLRSLKWACWSARLTDSQVADIFWNNAARLFGLG
jgi:predicted TIM-barrel fold metal-dependent hydrolase